MFPVISVSDVFTSASNFVSAYMDLFVAIMGVGLGVYILRQIVAAVRAGK